MTTDATPVVAESPPAPSKPEKKKKPKQKESTRDTVESILFAFVLAFLFRTFEAEAFVIPTGSMAPTLYGRHKETDCASCGFHLVVGASDEVNPETGQLWNSARLRSAVCPNCGADNPQIYDELAFNGDRILVNKYPYEIGDPDRWDVFVFKWPEEPQTNYIKRLVGLPGETIRIRGGNVFLWDNEKEVILRKDPDKQKRLQMPVYDNDHAPAPLLAAGWPERWASVKPSDVGRLANWAETEEGTGWKSDLENRSFSISNTAGQELNWLRYRHFFAAPADWENLERGKPFEPKSRLIGDYCGYNTYTGDNPQHFEAHTSEAVDDGPYWVADLTLNFDLDVQAVQPGGEVVLELCEGTYWYRCRINPATGAATLEEINVQMNERVKPRGSAETSITGPGSYSISFANVDDRLCLWINDVLVDFGEEASIDLAGATVNRFPTPTDLTPVGIAVTGVDATVSHLLLERDLYYRADFSIQDPRYHENKRFERDLIRHRHDPDVWGQVYLENADRLDTLELQVGDDHYLALGDNSPRSRDSRLWRKDMQSVPRKFLVGKAFLIYWPHGIPFLNSGKGFEVTAHKQPVNGRLQKVEEYPRYTIPFYPQFSRMKRIR